MKEIEEKVRQVVSFELGSDPEQITRKSRFVEDLGADSLDIIELVMAIEEEFQVRIYDETAEGWTTVGDVIEYLERNGATL
jgi:acyl carrier protein